MLLVWQHGSPFGYSSHQLAAICLVSSPSCENGNWLGDSTTSVLARWLVSSPSCERGNWLGDSTTSVPARWLVSAPSCESGRWWYHHICDLELWLIKTSESKRRVPIWLTSSWPQGHFRCHGPCSRSKFYLTEAEVVVIHIQVPTQAIQYVCPILHVSTLFSLMNQPPPPQQHPDPPPLNDQKNMKFLFCKSPRGIAWVPGAWCPRGTSLSVVAEVNPLPPHLFCTHLLGV